MGTDAEEERQGSILLRSGRRGVAAADAGEGGSAGAVELGTGDEVEVGRIRFRSCSKGEREEEDLADGGREVVVGGAVVGRDEEGS